jgi:sugar phosphate isomerase/epimerase
MNSSQIKHSIGCNIVDPICDEGDNYTKEIYLKNIPRYRNLGFTHLEFSHVTVLNEDDAHEIREFTQKLGIMPWSIHSEHLNRDSDAAIEEYFKTQEHCAKVAKALGTKICVCHIPNIQPRAAAKQRDIDLLSRLADITGKYGLKLAVETPPYEYIIELVDSIDRKDVGMNLDTGHSFLEGHNPASVAKAIGKRLITTHMQDNFCINDDHLPPGLGKIDWRETLKAIIATGYDGPFMLELTGGGVKQRRNIEQLRDFELDKEMVFAISYLNYLLEERD